MADISADSILPSGGDGITLSGSQIFIFGQRDNGQTGLGYAMTATVNASAGLTTVLSLSGRRVISYLTLNGLTTTSGTLRVQLLIDGTIHLDETQTSSTLGNIIIIGNSSQLMIKANSSIELKVTKPTATAAQAVYRSFVVI